MRDPERQDDGRDRGRRTTRILEWYGASKENISGANEGKREGQLEIVRTSTDASRSELCLGPEEEKTGTRLTRRSHRAPHEPER